MAQRPGDRAPLRSPRGRRIAGWVAAFAVVAGIALGVRLVGGSGDGSPSASPTGSAVAGDVGSITFGTSLDPVTGLVATPSRTSRFSPGDSFAYSVADLSPPPAIEVEVARVTDGPTEVVQTRTAQALGPGATVVAFSVPADGLLEAFGAGEFRMRIYLPDEDQPQAEGIFVLNGPSPSPGD